jgi:hypothetical protein
MRDPGEGWPGVEVVVEVDRVRVVVEGSARSACTSNSVSRCRLAPRVFMIAMKRHHSNH